MLYVIAIYAPLPTWYSEPSEEDDCQKVNATTDFDIASKFESLDEVNRIVGNLIKNNPLRSFKVDIAES